MTEYDSMGGISDAHSRVHRSIAQRRDAMRRSIAITTVCLARAQLGQGDLEPAVATAMSVPAEASAHPRIKRMPAAFGTSLHGHAPGSAPDRIWTAYTHDTWRTTA
ncbi:hypothetical protein [Kitasatospora sp. NPDC059599]|uniref:hypothetical protein n=1 Tax=Kitasatospora sp. NPDC059599 TaxID=3346880 RepID=UPI0036964FC1